MFVLIHAPVFARPSWFRVGEERGADDHAPDVPHAAEDDHAEDEHRDVEEEVARERRALERRVVGAGDAAEERAARVRPRLRPHQRDSHRRGRGLVLADRDPGAAEARVLQPQRAEDREQEQHDRRPEEDVGRLDLVAEVLRVAALEVVRRQEAAGQVREAVAEAERVERRDPVRPVRQVEAGAEEVVAVARDLRQDLAEAERHDREVVAAQAQRRQADDDPEERGDDAGERQQQPERHVDARQVRIDAHRAEMPGDVRELQRCEPGSRVGAGRVERDVPEIEQARVADDDVQADGHHHEHEHVDARSRRPARRRRPGS